MLKNSAIEPEPEPPGVYPLPSTHLLEKNESSFERAAAGTLSAIVATIDNLTSPIEDEKDKYLFCRKKTFDGPSGMFMQVSTYGFFGSYDPHAREYYERERQHLVAGVEIHVPVPNEDDDALHFSIEEYSVEKTMHGDLSLYLVTYDEATRTAVQHEIDQARAASLLFFLNNFSYEE